MSRSRKRREVEFASLSFLDCICCGFGAVILLLVLTKFAEPMLLEQTTEELEAIIVDREEQLDTIRGETRVVNLELTSKREQLSEIETRVARLQGDLSRLEGEFAASNQDAAVSSTVEGRLATARQELTEEMRRLLQDRPRDQSLVAGIPVDSEYIIFIIDTSGSMQNYSWPALLRKVGEVLDAYPKVKGMQVMNDMGAYLFPRYAGRWIPDTPSRRKVMIQTLAGWRPFSNSSPVEGITRAIQTYYETDKRISLYVFGDEFTGNSINDVLRIVDGINVADAEGNRLVRIHGVGFPFAFSQPSGLQSTGVRFAALMRALCYRNGGTFVALNDFRR